MLTEDESRHLWDGTIDEAEAFEAALLIAVAHHVMEDDDNVMPDLNKLYSKHRQRIRQAARRDFDKGFSKNAASDLRDVQKPPTGLREWAKTETGRIAQKAMDDASLPLDKLIDNMRESARQGYYATLRAAKRYSPRIGYEPALEAAVKELARNGITSSSYMRRDGVLVRVPVDVGIRRELTRAGKDRMTAQTLDIAGRSGAGLVDVSFCPDARISHARWQGKRYQLKGSGKYPNFNVACHVGDLVDGYGGYNCHHTIRIAYEGTPFGFTDPLEGTGYTNKQVRDLTSQQRRLENEIRKEKRVREVMRSEGLPTKESDALIRGYQKQLRELTNEHPQVLRRQPWREQIYDKSLSQIDDRIFPTYLNPDQIESVNTMRNAVDAWKKRTSGDLSLNLGAQRKHIKGTKEYAESVPVSQQRGYPAPSYLIIDEEACQELINLHAGKGSPVIINGKWEHKERCLADDTIGCIVKADGSELETRAFMIHYGDKAHIRPRREETW